MSVILEILFLFLEACYLWRFYAGLAGSLALVGLGDWLLPKDSGLRSMAIPLVVGGAIAGLIWEVVASRKKNRTCFVIPPALKCDNEKAIDPDQRAK